MFTIIAVCLFQLDLVDDFKTGDATGPEVTRSLANLADMLLQMKVSESVVVEKIWLMILRQEMQLVQKLHVVSLTLQICCCK